MTRVTGFEGPDSGTRPSDRSSQGPAALFLPRPRRASFCDPEPRIVSSIRSRRRLNGITIAISALWVRSTPWELGPRRGTQGLAEGASCVPSFWAIKLASSSQFLTLKSNVGLHGEFMMIRKGQSHEIMMAGSGSNLDKGVFSDPPFSMISAA